MGNPKTVRVEDGDGFRTINEDDFDKKAHKVYVEKAASGSMTVVDIKAKLDELEVEYPGNANKAKLEGLLAEATADPKE